MKEALRKRIFLKKGKIRREVLESLTEPKTATEISKELKLHRSSVSRVLINLEKNGFIVCVNPNDKSFRHYKKK